MTLWFNFTSLGATLFYLSKAGFIALIVGCPKFPEQKSWKHKAKMFNLNQQPLWPTQNAGNVK